MRGIEALALGALLVACGARSDLRAAGAGGRGAVGGSGSGAAGGEGGGANGGGGSGAACTRLSPPMPILSVGGDANVHQRTPQLVRPSADAGQVTLAMGWQLADPAPTPIELRHVSFSAWPSWPSGTLTPIYLADFDRGVTFSLSRSPNARVAALASGGFSAPFAGLALLEAIVPGAGDNPEVTPIDPASAQPLFVALSATRQLLGYRELGGVNQVTRLRVYDPSSTGLSAPAPLGCGSSSELPADAIPQGDGWLLAAASVGTIPDPCAEAGPVGPAQRIAVARVEATTTAEIGSIATDYPLQRLRLVPSGDGAWLVYDHVVPGNLLTAARLAADGQIATPPFAIEPVYDGGVAAAGLGDKLVVAWATSFPSLSLVLFDRDGTRLDELSVPLPGDAGYVDGPPALVASPDGDGVVLAWAYAAGVTRMRVTRIDCAD